MYKYLDTIKSVEDLKKIDINELPVLAFEIRDFLLKTVSETGGHLASNLGVVEMTIALHYCFDSPQDKFVWDVGHQSYIHKILTGRKDDFDSLRKFGGMSGFPKRCESPHDCFEAGHSSTSISAGIGFSKANKILGDQSHVVSIIGDAALTGGMAYEALNYAGQSDENLIVILNDNNMSISENVGGMSTYLSHLRLTEAYTGFKDIVSSIPLVGKPMRKGLGKVRDLIKYSVIDKTFFEYLGYKHVGPIDGHDVVELVYVFNRLKKINKPIFMHCITTKGKGYEPAEKNPEKYHGVSKFELDKGVQPKPANKTFSSTFGEKMIEMADKDESVVAITAAMPSGTGLVNYSNQYPERYVDVGIAEQNAVTMAAGLASSGIKPYVCVYSTFFQRAYDQILHDVCLQKLPVRLCLDRAGVVGADGETHHGLFDIAFMSHIPNMTIIAPKDGEELNEMLELSLRTDFPLAIRYPRGSSELFDGVPKDHFRSKVYGDILSHEQLKTGDDCVVVAPGNMARVAYDVACLLGEHEIKISVINPRTIHPVRSDLLESIQGYKHIVTLEDHVSRGGFGQLLQNELLDNNIIKKVEILAFPNDFVEHGDVSKLYKKHKLDRNSVAEFIRELVKGE